MKRLLFLLVIAVTVSGCAAAVKRGGAQIAYTDAEHPLADTAIFSAKAAPYGLGQIISVDGVSTSCWETGCPICVRVLPGRHTFYVRLTIFDNGITSYSSGDAEVVVENMKPLHTYAADYRLAGNSFGIDVIEEGGDPATREDLITPDKDSLCGREIEF